MPYPVLSPDGKYVIYTIRKWTESSQKSFTNLQFTEIITKKRGFITPAVLDQSDSSSSFSVACPNIFFSKEKEKYYIFHLTQTKQVRTQKKIKVKYRQKTYNYFII